MQIGASPSKLSTMMNSRNAAKGIIFSVGAYGREKTTKQGTLNQVTYIPLLIGFIFKERWAYFTNGSLENALNLTTLATYVR